MLVDLTELKYFCAFVPLSSQICLQFIKSDADELRWCLNMLSIFQAKLKGSLAFISMLWQIITAFFIPLDQTPQGYLTALVRIPICSQHRIIFSSITIALAASGQLSSFDRPSFLFPQNAPGIVSQASFSLFATAKSETFIARYCLTLPSPYDGGHWSMLPLLPVFPFEAIKKIKLHSRKQTKSSHEFWLASRFQFSSKKKFSHSSEQKGLGTLHSWRLANNSAHSGVVDKAPFLFSLILGTNSFEAVAAATVTSPLLHCRRYSVTALAPPTF